MSNNMTPMYKASGEEDTHFICNRYRFIKNVKTEGGILLNESVDTIDFFGSLFVKCGEGAFRTLDYSQYHTY